MGKNATLQAENLSLRQRTKHLSQKLKATQEHAEKARLTYQRRSTAEAAGSGAVRAAEEFVEERKRPRSGREKPCRRTLNYKIISNS